MIEVQLQCVPTPAINSHERLVMLSGHDSTARSALKTEMAFGLIRTRIAKRQVLEGDALSAVQTPCENTLCVVHTT